MTQQHVPPEGKVTSRVIVVPTLAPPPVVEVRVPGPAPVPTLAQQKLATGS